MLLYTDGITEAQNPQGELVDGERAAGWLAAAEAANADGVAASLLRRLPGGAVLAASTT